MRQFVVFFHIATIGRYQDIVSELLEVIHDSGMYEAMDQLYVGIVGNGTVLDLNKNKTQIIYRSSDLENYEFPTLAILQRFACENPAHSILYIHTKGVSTSAPYIEAIDDWRRYMSYFNIMRFSDCINYLQTFDVCGVDWHIEPSPHFSGNFWWATAEYIQRLPSIEAISHQNAKHILSLRHNAEFWIGMHPDVRAKSLFDSGIDVYKRHLHTLKRQQYERGQVSSPQYQFLICILQHRNANYALTAFLHLHAALHQDEELRRKCKIVFACTTHGSKELHALQRQFQGVYDLDIFECEGAYPQKLAAIFRRYPANEYPFFIKHDEDIFLSAPTWIAFLNQAAEILEETDNLLATVNLSTGIPSWSRFVQLFLNPAEQKALNQHLAQSRVPDELWGNDYSPLNEFIASQAGWDEDGYWERVNSLGYHYRGLHPVRVDLYYPLLINQAVLSRYAAFQARPVHGDFEQVSNRYICNSFFCIRYDLYQEILADRSLYVDIFDEVPLNQYAQQHGLKFCFLEGSLGVHVLYNSVYDQSAKMEKRVLTGRQWEHIFLDQYLVAVRKYLKAVGFSEVDSIRTYQSPLVSRIKTQLKSKIYGPLRLAWRKTLDVTS